MSSLSARRRFDVVVTCSAASADSAELLGRMEYRPRSPDMPADSAAESGLGSLLAELGGLVVAGDVALVLAVALVVALLACRQA